MKVFLGGTCNESTWRERLISQLNVDYYNPVVDDWTPECMEEELRQRKECEICLYVITPKMSGVYSIAEVIDDSNKRPDRTILTLLRADDGEEFSEPQWKSLMAVSQMANRNGVSAFFDIEETALYINVLLTPMGPILTG